MTRTGWTWSAITCIALFLAYTVIIWTTAWQLFSMWLFLAVIAGWLTTACLGIFCLHEADEAPRSRN